MTRREPFTSGASVPVLEPRSGPRWTAGVLGIALAALAFLFPARGFAQDPSSDPRRSSGDRVGDAAATDLALVEQLRELRRRMLKLEAALEQGRRGLPPGRSGGTGVSMGKEMPPKGMPDQKLKSGPGAMGRPAKGRMPGIRKPTSGRIGMAAGMGMRPGRSFMGGRGMRMMGRMERADAMALPSALPGFPGASHIYHIGSTSLFLDHDEHITLSRDQRAKLSRLKEQTLLAQATFERRIEEAEQELWRLTASDKPEIAKIDAQVRKIATLQGDQRIAFIRAVGEAAGFLTDEQRKTLIGTLSAGQESGKPDPQKKTE